MHHLPVGTFNFKSEPSFTAVKKSDKFSLRFNNLKRTEVPEDVLECSSEEGDQRSKGFRLSTASHGTNFEPLAFSRETFRWNRRPFFLELQIVRAQ